MILLVHPFRRADTTWGRIRGKEKKRKKKEKEKEGRSPSKAFGLLRVYVHVLNGEEKKKRREKEKKYGEKRRGVGQVHLSS